MHKHARLGGCLGACSPRKCLEIRCPEIASEAILGQKQSRSYMACGVLHPISGCPRMPMTFPMPVDFEFPREKVLRLAEQKVGWNELTNA